MRTSKSDEWTALPTVSKTNLTKDKLWYSPLYIIGLFLAMCIFHVCDYKTYIFILEKLLNMEACEK